MCFNITQYYNMYIYIYMLSIFFKYINIVYFYLYRNMTDNIDREKRNNIFLSFFIQYIKNNNNNNNELTK